MNDQHNSLIEARALRDAARANFLADIEYVKTSLTGKSLAERTVDRIAGGASDVLDTAKTTASDNRGIVAVLIGAVILWLARYPLIEAVLAEFSGGQSSDAEKAGETGGAAPVNDDQSENNTIPDGGDAND